MKVKGPLSDLININEDYKSNKIISIITVVGAFLFSGYIYFSQSEKLDRERSSVFVLQNGKSIYIANRENMSENRPAEIKHHVTILMNLLFSISPDNASVNENNKQALYLGDQSVKKFIDQLTEKKYYDQLIAASASQSLKLDTNSIQLDLSTYPIKIVVKGTEQIVRLSNITIKEITCSMDVINVNRSDNNPHGLLVENFSVISNNTIETKVRDTNNN